MSESLMRTLEGMGNPRLLVVGDMMLDRYTFGHAERVSPEAAVVVLRAENEELRPGGAASVAFLARGLDAEVCLVGVVGADADGSRLTELLGKAGVDTGLVLRDMGRPTTTKQRVIGRAGGGSSHPIVRVDRERRDPISPVLERQIWRTIAERIGEFQAVLISDYNKGLCTPRLLREVITAARVQSVPVLVDPARIADYARYRRATLLKPNRAEAELASDQTVGSGDEAITAAQRLCQQCHAEAVLVTLDRDGMVLVPAEGSAKRFPTAPRTVVDITGAGDMALAAMGLGIGGGLTLETSVLLANAAAGLEVERLGIAQVSREELLASVTDRRAAGRSWAGTSERRVVTLDRMAALADEYRRQGRSVVLTNGCFDLLHVGHLRCLEEAAALGDVLVVAVNSDASVRRLKGSSRPVVTQENRVRLLAALSCVDHVLLFDEDTPHEVLRRVRPDVLVKGGGYSPAEVVGRALVEAYGGRVAVTGRTPGVSTTEILEGMGRKEEVTVS